MPCALVLADMGGWKLTLLSPKHTNARGEIPEEITETFIDGIWYTIARD